MGSAKIRTRGCWLKSSNSASVPSRPLLLMLVQRTDLELSLIKAHSVAGLVLVVRSARWWRKARTGTGRADTCSTSTTRSAPRAASAAASGACTAEAGLRQTNETQLIDQIVISVRPNSVFHLNLNSSLGLSRPKVWLLLWISVFKIVLGVGISNPWRMVMV